MVQEKNKQRGGGRGGLTAGSAGAMINTSASQGFLTLLPVLTETLHVKYVSHIFSRGEKKY
jgi:hypothetical protein